MSAASHCFFRDLFEITLIALTQQNGMARVVMHGTYVHALTDTHNVHVWLKYVSWGLFYRYPWRPPLETAYLHNSRRFSGTQSSESG